MPSLCISSFLNKTVVIRNSLFLLFICTFSISQAQKAKKADRELITNLQNHIRYLAGDSLEGRRTGTAGEKLAAQYIGNAFKEAGLQPKGTDNYYQSFQINE